MPAHHIDHDKHAWPAAFGDVIVRGFAMSRLCQKQSPYASSPYHRLRMGDRADILTNGLTGAAIGVLQLGVTISLAALIFSGPLGAGAGRAAAGFVLGTAIVSLLVGSTSRLQVVTAGAQDTAAVLVAAVASAIVATPGLRDGEMLSTVVVMIAIAGVATGLVFWLIGRFGLTTFVRFLPYPVISGFTAGTGWLLLRGGVQVMHGRPITSDFFRDIFSWSELKFLLPGIALALTILMVLSVRRVPNVLVSVAMLSATLLFHIVGRSASSFSVLEAEGWFIGPFESDSGWSPIGPDDLRNTDWSVLLDNSVLIAAVVAVSVVGILLNLSGLEGDRDANIDMNHEIRSAGLANLAVGATGGLIGYHLLGDTLLGRQIGGRGRSVPIVIAAMAGVIFVIGPDVIAQVPRAVAGGVLAGLGVSMLAAWARQALPRMNRGDQLLSSFILVTIAVLGVLTGVGAGVVVAAAVFIVKYSRTNPVRHVIDAAGRSRVDRRHHDQMLLSSSPQTIVAFELQGYLFFGSITGLRRQIDAHLDESTTDYLILDFARVTGIDSTAASGVAAIATALDDRNIAMLWSGLQPHLATELRAGTKPVAHVASDLDHAIAWCEDLVLANANIDVGTDPPSIDPFSPDIMRALDLPTIELDAGTTLISTGDADHDIYFVESGTLTAWLHRDDGQPIRIRQMLPGAVLGEIAFVTGAPRTATVRADTPVVVQVLRRDRFDEIAVSNPEIALAVQQELLRRIGARLASSSAMVRDLLE